MLHAVMLRSPLVLKAMVVAHLDVMSLMIPTVGKRLLAAITLLKTKKHATVIVLPMTLALLPGKRLIRARMFAWSPWSWVLPSSVWQLAHTTQLHNVVQEMVAVPMDAWAEPQTAA